MRHDRGKEGPHEKARAEGDPADDAGGDERTLRSPTDRKVLKVQVPLDMYWKLHQLKIVGGKNISDAVEEALHAYFADSGKGSGPGARSRGRPRD